MDHLENVARGHKGRQILWNDEIEVDLNQINIMVSTETLMNYPDRRIISTIQNYVYDKKLGAIISKKKTN